MTIPSLLTAAGAAAANLGLSAAAAAAAVVSELRWKVTFLSAAEKDPPPLIWLFGCRLTAAAKDVDVTVAVGGLC